MMPRIIYETFQERELSYYANRCRISVDGEVVGELYRESGMDEWAADGDLEAAYGMNVACGYKQLRHALRSLIATIRGHEENK